MALRDGELEEIRTRIRDGEEDRKKFEPLWHECLAFASGRLVRWQGVGTYRRLVPEPVKQGQDRYAVDMLAQYRQTVHAELDLDDDRPQLLFRSEDLPNRDYAEVANKALGYGWDVEWRGDDVLRKARYQIIDVGTVGLRCVFDPNQGELIGRVPHFQGKPVWNKEEAFKIAGEGGTLSIKDARRGKIRWLIASPFQLVVPPGIAESEDFPWECWMDVIPVEEAKALYGGDFLEDDIAPLSTVQPDDHNPDGQSRKVALKGYCKVYHYFQKPTKDFPAGRVVRLKNESMDYLEDKNELPYVSAAGEFRSGIHYMHYIPLTHRFWSRSMMELGIAPAREYAKRRTQLGMIYAKGQPKVASEVGALKATPTGIPGEHMLVNVGKPLPTVWPGLSPNPAMYSELEWIRKDLEYAIGLRVSLGENPPNVATYSQLSLLKESETRKLDSITHGSQQVIMDLTEDTVYDIKKYWGKDKTIMIAGDGAELESFQFDTTPMQEVFYRLEIARGAAKPRTQAARLQLVADLWTAALNSGLVQQNPQGWWEWLQQSNEAGEPAPAPTHQPDYNQVYAGYAVQMISRGELPPILDYLDPQIFIPAIRELQTRAALAGDEEIRKYCQQFLDAYASVMQAKNAAQALNSLPTGAGQAAAMMQEVPGAAGAPNGNSPGGPSGPPGTVPLTGPPPGGPPAGPQG
jgi:hypothetical protein